MRRFFYAIFVMAAVVFAVGKSWHVAKDGFHILRTHFPLEETPTEPLSKEALAALQQNYRYLGRGHQCYAFESTDGLYVLKLIRADRYELPFWLKQVSWLKKRQKKKETDIQRRCQFLKASFVLAAHPLRSVTGIVAMHLGKTSEIHHTATIIDRLGRRYYLDLDQTAFILQKKKALMMPQIAEAIRSKNTERAKLILNAFLELIQIRSNHGIFNKDPSFLKNFGYDAEGAFQIDIGSFYYKTTPPNTTRDAFRETTHHVFVWLHGQNATLADWFQDRCEEIQKTWD
jgi:hypothetical protein